SINRNQDTNCDQSSTEAAKNHFCNVTCRIAVSCDSVDRCGLPPNSLSTEASIKQGCLYFASLVKRSKELGCDQDSIIQAYNYGGGYLDHVGKNGKKHSFALAESFSKEKSGGQKVDYPNPIAIKENGGWRYNYGNMFY
ncbi:lysozyme family protein, partial [Enterococcus faecium]|uniref:lysozyme family protein n=1 Tax=Enterococcus faecium TaxID=1352 RepID=UPI000A7F6A2D